MRLTIQNAGGDALVAKLGAVPAKVAENLKTTVEALEQELVEKIRNATPVRTGALKNSIEGQVISTAHGAIATVGANPTGGGSKGSRRDFYALFVEFGTQDRIQKTTGRKVGKITAEMFVHGPFNQMKGKILGEMRKAVDEGLNG
jgi:HK97 gp10 family phage protein